MAGISPRLPLSLSEDGYRLNKTLTDAIAQDFKNLVLTSPGERVMDPEFGVGIRNFLFEQAGPILYGSIESKLEEQVRTYMPFIEIEELSMGAPSDNPLTADNLLVVHIKYRILTTDQVDILSISVPQAI